MKFNDPTSCVCCTFRFEEFENKKISLMTKKQLIFLAIKTTKLFFLQYKSFPTNLTIYTEEYLLLKESRYLNFIKNQYSEICQMPFSINHSLDCIIHNGETIRSILYNENKQLYIDFKKFKINNL